MSAICSTCSCFSRSSSSCLFSRSSTDFPLACLLAFSASIDSSSWLISAILVLFLSDNRIATCTRLSKRKMFRRGILPEYYLEADAIAPQMVQTPKKIDSMGLTDIEERKREKPTIWRRAGVLPLPSINEDPRTRNNKDRIRSVKESIGSISVVFTP